MPELALVLYLVYLALAFGLRSFLQRRRTGSAGFHGVSGRPGSPEWLGGVLFAVATLAGLAAPILALLGIVTPVEVLEAGWSGVLGAALAVVGIACALLAQREMGASWRIGVDSGEQTRLVTGGIFGVVRNPFFAASLAVACGLVLMVPSVVAIGALIALVVAVELQVRVVEEPYLLAAQGETYAAYARRTGRFLPGVGRLTV
ncbi:MAG: isoprenylcysteine carboxylmethyltransferase family protein [Solirubrobacteraceae bacterium]|nr:isoprenylcysteine carboxylmethyltransferase family protein [Solirubrobacteraceae bacterium]